MIKNRSLFIYLCLLLMYGLGLFTGAIVGKYWIIPFLFTGIISSLGIILIEIHRRNYEW